MSKKEDFTNLNTGRVYGAINEATKGERKPRKEYSGEEARALAQTLHTSGRKGVKLPRINLAFAPDVYDYINTMSRVRGENMTQFVNHVLTQYMEEHKDIYEKAIEFRNSL